MIKTMAGLDIPRDVWGQRLPFWSNPINDWTLHSLGVISPGAVGTLLNLLVMYENRRRTYIVIHDEHTRSAIKITSSSEEDMRRLSRPGTDRSSSRKTARSLRSLQ